MACALVSIAFTPLPGAAFLVGVGANDFVKCGACVASAPQDPAQPLLGLFGGTGPTYDDRNLDLRQIHSFVQHTVGNQRRVGAIRESPEDLRPFFLLAVTEQTRDQES